MPFFKKCVRFHRPQCDRSHKFPEGNCDSKGTCGALIAPLRSRSVLSAYCKEVDRPFRHMPVGQFRRCRAPGRERWCVACVYEPE